MRADSFTRPDGHLSRQRFLMAWWQVQGDVPVLAVVSVFSAGVFTRPDAGPCDVALREPFSEQLVKVPMPVPRVSDVENTVRADPLQVRRVDAQKRVDGCADVRCKPDSANHAPLTV